MQKLNDLKQPHVSKHLKRQNMPNISGASRYNLQFFCMMFLVEEWGLKFSVYSKPFTVAHHYFMNCISCRVKDIRKLSLIRAPSPESFNILKL